MNPEALDGRVRDNHGRQSPTPVRTRESPINQDDTVGEPERLDAIRCPAERGIREPIRIVPHGHEDSLARDSADALPSAPAGSPHSRSSRFRVR